MQTLPEKLCNVDRLVSVLKDRNLDGIVVCTRPNVFYLSTMSSRAMQSHMENNISRYVIFSRSAPDHPIVVLPDYDLNYFVDTQSWVSDRRSYSTDMLPWGYPIDDAAFDRFVPHTVRDTEWGKRAREAYSPNPKAAVRGALADLGLTNGRVGFDDLRVANVIAGDLPLEIVDAYVTMQFVRQVKTPEELALLSAAASVNEAALTSAIADWQRGESWTDLTNRYHVKVLLAGGFVHDPGGIVVGNPPGDDKAFYMVGRDEHVPIEVGSSMVFDCHGTINQYCWDGGKTWVVADERTGVHKLVEEAVQESLLVVEAGMSPGAKLDALEKIGREVFVKKGVPDADRALVFFHGLGLDHQDMEIPLTGRQNVSMVENMILSIHVVYPGGPGERYYIEDNAVVTPSGGKSLYSWGVESFH